MKLLARVNNQTVPVEVTRTGETFTVVVGERRYTVDVRSVLPGTYSLLIENRAHEAVVQRQPESRVVHLNGSVFAVDLADPRQRSGRRSAPGEASGRRAVKAPMPGKVVRVLVRAGDAVKYNQGLLVLEAMKMQNEIKAPKAGHVHQVAVEPDTAVNAGDLLVVIE